MPGVAIVRARLLSLEEEEEEEEVGVASVDLFMVSVEMTAPVLLIIQYVFPGFWILAGLLQYSTGTRQPGTRYHSTGSWLG